MSDKPTRRRFLQAGCATLAAATLARVETPSASASEPDLDVGRHIYKSLKWGMIKHEGTTLEKFQLLVDLGYDGVELDSPGGVDKQEAIAAAKATGLPIEGIVNSTHWRVRHSDPDPAVRAQALENMRTAMRDAALVGADSVLLVPGKVTDEARENHDHVWNRSIADIQKLLPLAEELRIKILIENVGNGFCLDPKQFAAYVDRIDSPWVGIHFDIGNHIWCGPPADWIRVLGTRIKKLDAKDRTRQKVSTKIGQGHADWPQVRKALREIGFTGWCAAEVSGGGRQRLAEILHRMNQTLGKSDGNPPHP